MRDERRGIVPLAMPDGRAVPLRFTWRAIDQLGRGGVTALFSKVEAGEPGDMTALAKLIEAASGGELTADAILQDPPPFNDAFVAVLEAWALAARLPQGVKRAENPLNRPWTSLRTLWGRLWR